MEEVTSYPIFVALEELREMSRGFGRQSIEPQNSVHAVSQPTPVADMDSIQQSLIQHFGDIEDPRVERTKKHQLTDILVIAILAVIAETQGFGHSLLIVFGIDQLVTLQTMFTRD